MLTGQDTSEFMSKLNVEGKTRMQLDYTLFKGISVDLFDLENAEEKAASMARMRSVVNMWPVEVFSVPKPKIEWVGAPEGETAKVFRRQDNGTDTYSPHVMVQVDKLRAEGITGKGIKVAVIDTGVSPPRGDERHD